MTRSVNDFEGVVGTGKDLKGNKSGRKRASSKVSLTTLLSTRTNGEKPQTHLVLFQPVQTSLSVRFVRSSGERSSDLVILDLVRPFPHSRFRSSSSLLRQQAQHSRESSPVIMMVMSDDDIRDLVVFSEAGSEERQVLGLTLRAVDEQEGRVRADEVGVGA